MCSSLCTTRATRTVSAMSRICGYVSFARHRLVTSSHRRPLTSASFRLPAAAQQQYKLDDIPTLFVATKSDLDLAQQVG